MPSNLVQPGRIRLGYSGALSMTQPGGYSFFADLGRVDLGRLRPGAGSIPVPTIRYIPSTAVLAQSIRTIVSTVALYKVNSRSITTSAVIFSSSKNRIILTSANITLNPISRTIISYAVVSITPIQQLAVPVGLVRYGSGKYMIESLMPDYYWQSDFVNQFMMSLGVEIDFIARWLAIPPQSVLNQALTTGLQTPLEGLISAWFVRLASGSRLNLWENMLGIVTDQTLPDSSRQATILNQIKNRGQSPTVQYINSLVQQYVQQSVTQDHFSDSSIPDYNFRIRILKPTGLPPTYNLMLAQLAKLAPQHLQYTIVYTETSWSTLGNRDWATLGNASWSTLTY